MQAEYWVGLLLVLLLLAGCSTMPATRTQKTPPPDPQEEALVQAARAGNADTVKALLATSRVNVNATDERGSTALIEAARFGHDDVARLLLAAGANVKARDRDGKTALMLAIVGGHDDVVEALKQAGAVE